MYTTQTQIRDAFWNIYCVNGKPREYRGKSQNDLPCDVRCAFVEFVNALAMDGQISEALAERVTL
jgi:hypothetical protein